MSKTKICIVVSRIEKSLGLEWTARELKNHYDLTFVLLNPSDTPLENFLKENNINVIRIKLSSKNDFLKVFVRLCLCFFKMRPAIVHTHLFEATLLGLTAAWVTGVKKRIYTRHTSTFHHLYFPGAVKYDRLSNRIATQIVSISQATDYALMQLESVPLSKVKKIPHGFDLEIFSDVKNHRIQNVKERWGIPDTSPCIGVIARQIEWKGVQYILPAFEKFQLLYPDACLILANASGPYHGNVMKLVESIPQGRVIEIPFEEDVAALFKSFHLYVHTPIDSTCEAFGQTYIEAMASGVPSIFTLSGIAAEFVKDGNNALVVDFKNSDQIYDALVRLWTDKKLYKDLTESGPRSVRPAFFLGEMVRGLKKLYDD